MQLTHHILDTLLDTVISAAADTPAADIAELMRDEGVVSVVIVDDRPPVGIVTLDDMIQLFAGATT